MPIITVIILIEFDHNSAASEGAPANGKAIFFKSHSLTILQSKDEWMKANEVAIAQVCKHTHTLLGQCTFECVFEWCFLKWPNEKCIERKSGSASMKVSTQMTLFPLPSLTVSVSRLSISNLFKGIPFHLTSIWQLSARSSIDFIGSADDDDNVDALFRFPLSLHSHACRR